MAKRTSQYSLFPWRKGLNTSDDPSLLEPGELTIANNIIFDYNEYKKRREGIDSDWDTRWFTSTTRSSTGTTRTINGTFPSGFIAVGDKISLSGSSNSSYNGSLMTVTASSAGSISYTAVGSLSEASTPELDIFLSNKVVGGIDYWFGTVDNKAQFLITVLDNGAVYRTASGTRVRLVDSGVPWTIAASGLTEANLEVFQNRVIIAVSGATNQMKYWDGDTAETLKDLPAYGLTASVSRSSTGTTRTITFASPIDISNGSRIFITGGPSTYNGSFVLLSGSGTATITYTAGTSLSEGTTADTEIRIGVNAPLALFLRAHGAHLYTNDKQRLEFIHYSGSGNPFEWGGIGTSGGFPIGEGDGDPAGLTGIAPTFKGNLFIGKRTKLYRLDNMDPEITSIIKVSNGIGFLSHQGITAIDQDDVFFVSERGFHSLVAVNAYGDFNAPYISDKIQGSFVEDFEESRKRYIKSAWMPELNSALFAVAEDGSARNNSIYLYNVKFQTWYKWPNVEAETLITAQDADRRRIYLGNYEGRLARTLTLQNFDTDREGTEMTIITNVTTGQIFPEERTDLVRGFKRVRLIYRGEGAFSIICVAKIDNFAPQTLVFSQTVAGAALGSFVLGEDVLGGASVTAPYSLPVDGFGRSIQLSIQQNDRGQTISVLGFMIEYSAGGDSPETRQGSDK